jgi:hypothetical protein
MSTAAQSTSVFVLKELVRKLKQRRLPEVPPLLAALTGFVLGAEFLTFRITAVEITGSGTVLARVDGDVAERRALGRYPDILRSWLHLISRADWSPREFMEVQ